ncbi:hypothetical protein JCM8547_004028 [Rhodosporidiobolus lusitaniae]
MSDNKQEEQQFSTQPIEHTNGHLNFPGSKTEATPGLGSAPTLQELHNAQSNPHAGRGSGPYVPSSDIAQGLEAPKSREELQALAAKLNE